MDNRSGWKLGVGYKTRPRTGDAGAFAGSGSKLQGVWFGWTAGQLGWDWDSWHHHSVAQGRPLLTTPNHGFGYNPDIYFIGSSRSRHQDKTRNKIGRVRPQLIGSHLAHDMMLIISAFPASIKAKPQSSKVDATQSLGQLGWVGGTKSKEGRSLMPPVAQCPYTTANFTALHI